MLTRTNIQEANKQLHAMHQRIASLEATVQHQNQSLLDRDGLHQQQLQQLSDDKDAQIQQLQHSIHTLQQVLHTRDTEISQLQEQVQSRDKQITELGNVVSSVQSLFKHMPSLKSVVDVMDTLQVHLLPNYGTETNTNGDSSKEYLQENSVQMPSILNHVGEVSNSVNISTMAQQYATSQRSRNFSISEEDQDEIIPMGENYESGFANGPNSEKVSEPGKEFYL